MSTFDTIPCSYCTQDVTWDGRVWVDDTEGDVCSGDYGDINRDGVHRVFQPILGITGTCLQHVPADEEEGYGDTCMRCFTPETAHTRQPRPLENSPHSTPSLVEYVSDLT